MKKVTIISTAILIIFILMINISCKDKTKSGALIKNNASGNSVLIELFTSQGCSSCPPADKLLGKYAQQHDEHIIPIAFHVDYWNRLGWKDSFSTAAFTTRQQEYAGFFASDGVYTPQAVLNGSKEMVGSDETKITAAIDEFLKEKPAATIVLNIVSATGNKIIISTKLSGATDGQTLNAALVEKEVTTQIKAGENKGMKLINYNVVRDLKTTDAVASGNFSFDLTNGKPADQFMVVAFLQNKRTGKVSAAVEKNF